MQCSTADVVYWWRMFAWCLLPGLHGRSHCELNICAVKKVTGTGPRPWSTVNFDFGMQQCRTKFDMAVFEMCLTISLEDSIEDVSAHFEKVHLGDAKKIFLDKN